DRHATIDGAEIRLRFKGKAAKVHEVSCTSPRLARLVRKCQDLPGQVLFQYVVDDAVVPITSLDVNEYLRGIAGSDVTAKSFRTWGASVLAARALAKRDL